jgi:L-threonylcarbamoyladenylate synthase
LTTTWHIRQAVRALHAGGIIAYPTETVYGLGCDPLNPHAVTRLLELKQRSMEKGLILIGATLEQLLPYIDISDTALFDKLATPTQRPTTWICPLHANVPHWLSGRHRSIAVRITTHPLARQLCLQFGDAIVSTSANPPGLSPARNTLDVKRYFGENLDHILCGSSTADNQPSRIIDLLSGNVIRN